MSDDTDKLLAKTKKLMDEVDECKYVIQKEQTENGKLRSQLYAKTDRFWREEELTALKREIERHNGIVAGLNATIGTLNHESKRLRCQLDMAKGQKESLESELCDMKMRCDALEARPFDDMARLKDEIEELKQKLNEAGSKEEDAIVYLPPDHAIARMLNDVFMIEGDGGEVNDSDLYDVFMESIPPTERERIIEQIFQVRNPGKKVPEQEIKRFRTQGGRMCKGDFASCLQAIGGVVKKKGTRKIWVNVKKRTADAK